MRHQLARFRFWLRYRRFLGDLVRDDRHEKIRPTRARIEHLKDQARRAADAVERHRK